MNNGTENGGRLEILVGDIGLSIKNVFQHMLPKKIFKGVMLRTCVEKSRKQNRRLNVNN